LAKKDRVELGLSLGYLQPNHKFNLCSVPRRVQFETVDRTSIRFVTGFASLVLAVRVPNGMWIPDRHCLRPTANNWWFLKERPSLKLSRFLVQRSLASPGSVASVLPHSVWELCQEGSPLFELTACARVGRLSFQSQSVIETATGPGPGIIGDYSMRSLEKGAIPQLYWVSPAVELQVFGSNGFNPLVSTSDLALKVKSKKALHRGVAD